MIPRILREGPLRLWDLQTCPFSLLRPPAYLLPKVPTPRSRRSSDNDVGPLFSRFRRHPLPSYLNSFWFFHLNRFTH